MVSFSGDHTVRGVAVVVCSSCETLSSLIRTDLCPTCAGFIETAAPTRVDRRYLGFPWQLSKHMLRATLPRLC